jgi:hypothetical protein
VAGEVTLAAGSSGPDGRRLDSRDGPGRQDPLGGLLRDSSDEVEVVLVVEDDETD